MKGFGEGFQEMKVLWVSIKSFSEGLLWFQEGRQRKGSRNDAMGSTVSFAWRRWCFVYNKMWETMIFVFDDKCFFLGIAINNCLYIQSIYLFFYNCVYISLISNYNYVFIINGIFNVFFFLKNCI
jgi:hypothetical protein